MAKFLHRPYEWMSAEPTWTHRRHKTIYGAQSAVRWASVRLLFWLTTKHFTKRGRNSYIKYLLFWSLQPQKQFLTFIFCSCPLLAMSVRFQFHRCAWKMNVSGWKIFSWVISYERAVWCIQFDVEWKRANVRLLFIQNLFSCQNNNIGYFCFGRNALTCSVHTFSFWFIRIFFRASAREKKIRKMKNETIN